MPNRRPSLVPIPAAVRSACLAPLGLMLLLGCDSSLKRVGDGGVNGAGGAAGPGITIGDASVTAPDGGDPVAPGAGEQCAEEAITAEVAPLDLLVVLDASGSMRQAVAQKTRWDWVVEALGKFVVDPRSAGVGVGLDVFPLIINSKPCTSENDCGGGSGTSNQLCVQLHLCAAPGTDLQTTRSCDPSDAFCPAGSKCLPAGTCSKTGDRCLDVGQACPGGVAGNTCSVMGNVCKTPIFSCEVGDYDQPLVPIAPLPGGAAVLTARLATTKPEGDTPLQAAYEGARLHLAQYLAAHPDHKGALVVASDGAPSGCPGGDVPAVVASIAAAAGAMPAIPTYAIGVLAPGDGSLGPALEQMATAGGTGKPFAVTTSADFGDKFLGALNDIRGKALPCEFDIPTPAAGAIDYGKVNVRTIVGATPVDLHYVKNADACVTTTAGWFYDTDPNVSPPKRIHLCDAVCQPLKADVTARVELRFGCRTRID